MISEDTKVFIVVPSEYHVRASQQSRQLFIDSFRMPHVWWSDHIHNANGYFGCETTRDAGNITGFNTWAYFEVKHLTKDLKYHWSTVRLFTRWLPSTNQTGILLFDSTEDIWNSLLTPDLDRLKDPFWVYSCVLEEVSRLEERAVWNIRDQVRELEKAPPPSGWKPQPNYRQLHDIARHSIHVTESLEVTVQNVEHIVRQHEIFVNTWTDCQAETTHLEMSRRLAFFQSYIGSIRLRSVSNEKRLQNEIQLAFNIVAQHDAGLTVDISRAARSDSATMKTLAFVTLTFLPPTFISAIFSMSFFNYDTGSGWSVSNKIWIYWAIAIPTTVATALVWNCWPKYFPGDTENVHYKEAKTVLSKSGGGDFVNHERMQC
ncbi:hypothetical protein N7474_001771 [Penicillium riverlandense]|uniref:uncharacterized protein n=1 Tax=Penicillium riverlandense TaxID=1903569 RepID=UPI00254683D9|nr:uncharacterized protein N7474_001771 [Penicillium riverlandense]KAJ5833460.1 hypothetical protein N7474_001771 [Penicillium riverlandense]